MEQGEILSYWKVSVNGSYKYEREKKKKGKVWMSTLEMLESIWHTVVVLRKEITFIYLGRKYYDASISVAP